MKIVITSPYDFSYPGGVQSHIFELSRELLRLNHDVTIAAPLSNKNIHNLPSVKFISLGKPVSFSFLGSKNRISINLLKIIKCIFYLRKNKYDVIHIHEPLLPSQIIINIFTKTLKIASFHAYSHKKNYLYIVFNFLLKLVLRRISQKICVSKFSKLYINKYFLFDSVIIPNGINLENFSYVSKKSKKSYKDISLLFVGRFDETRKGFPILLSSFIELKKIYNDLRLIVIGPGNKNIYNKKSNLKDILFLGTIDQKNLPKFYQNSDIVCLPSTENESFGIIILEAMATGSVLVSSDIDSYKDILCKNQYGFLFESKSVKSLTNTLSNIISKKINTKENLENGLNNVKKYSWPKLVSEIIGVYTKEKNIINLGKF